jgi:hypothetical protein
MMALAWGARVLQLRSQNIIAEIAAKIALKDGRGAEVSIP